jgi:hypothetical protein
MSKIEEMLKINDYPGRGIIIGRDNSGECAVIAYFIMGRSENSRNRIFSELNGIVRTQAHEPSKLSDPSLIIYNAVRALGNKTIVSNGDHTDTIYDCMDRQMTFEQALRMREFEPDKPNYTPRISGIVHLNDKSACGFNYALSIIKTDGGCPDSVQRFNFAYNNPIKGKGHFIHTYSGNGNPLPGFVGEPRSVEISGNINEFMRVIWDSMNIENKISLYTRFIDVKTGKYESGILNKNNGD